MSHLFELKDFTVTLHGDDGAATLADSIELFVDKGETLCVVGESGSGKSVTMLSAIRLMEFVAPVQLTGSATLDGVELTRLSQREMAKVRGARIAMIFQEAMEALNPTRSVAAQLVEAYAVTHPGEHAGKSEMLAAARSRSLRLLEEVGMPDPAAVMGKFPHQLSGGMQQRVMIAMALIGDPELLIADEPTTALDVTIQSEILQLLRRLQRDHGMACILITHDMGVASEMADRIAVLYAGQVVETGSLEQMLTAPQHPYTKALLECIPRPGVRLRGRMRTIPGSVPAPTEQLPGDRFAPRNALASERDRTQPPPVRWNPEGTHMVRAWDPVTTWTPQMVDALTGWTVAADDRDVRQADPAIVLKDVSKTYASGRGISLGKTSGTRALDEVSLTIAQGEFFGIVGETGSGKSTLGRIVMDLEAPDRGSRLSVAGIRLDIKRTFAQEKELRRRVQMVFQNPQDTLDPRRTVGQAIAEPLHALTDLSRRDIEARVREMLDAVGLPSRYVGRYSSELSGGQRQRVAIARAIAPRPRIVVADEPTSALDVSVQGQIMNLLLDLRQEMGLTYVFITHNLSLITAVADRIGVMYRGRLVEVADAESLAHGGSDDYTRRLFLANPDPFARMPGAAA